MKGATHDGSYHSDDLLATVLLQTLFPGLTIVRTRDPQLIEKADVVYDVGGVYDRSKLRFDHHQLGFNEQFYGTGLSSAGLIFRDFWSYLVGSEDVAVILYNTFVKRIDMHDNGIAFDEFSNFFAQLEQLGTSFEDSVKQMAQIFDVYLRFAYKLANDYRVVLDAMNNQANRDKHYLTLPADINYYECLEILNYDRSIWFIYTRKDGYHRIRTVRCKHESFNSIFYFPYEWAGLRDEELDNATGVPGGVFVHKGRFLGIWKTENAANRILKILLKLCEEYVKKQQYM